MTMSDWMQLIGLGIVILGGLVSTIWWASNVSSLLRINNDSQEKTNETLEKMLQQLGNHSVLHNSHDKRLTRLEDKVGIPGMDSWQPLKSGGI